MPDDKLFWYHPCLNKDDTGSGFYLTDELRDAIKSYKIVKGGKVLRWQRRLEIFLKTRWLFLYDNFEI